jgi:hypothetical protein
MKLWSKESYVWLNDFGTKKKTISENLSRIHTQKVTKLKVENYLFDKFEKIPHVRLAKYYEKK